MPGKSVNGRGRRAGAAVVPAAHVLRLPFGGRSGLVPWLFLFGLLAALLASGGPAAAQSSGNKIRLGGGAPEPDTAPAENQFGEARRGFDYESFQSRLENHWFERKAYLADGRYEDADKQSEKIRDFCAEEGVKRLPDLSGALIAEARRLAEEGDSQRAIESLRLAEEFDPGRPQVHLARASVYWHHGMRVVPAATELVAALRTTAQRSIASLTLLHRVVLVLSIAAMGCVLLFSTMMLWRYQIPFRHEVEEWVEHFAGDPWTQIAGWALLLLPLVLWIGGGWIAVYWIVIMFRFMRRSERATAAVLLLACTLAFPAYRATIGLFRMSSDPVVRTTLASAGGEYDPDRILELQQLVAAHPENAVYRFLLGGLYRNGRYFEEAYFEYKTAIELDPDMAAAHINVGNIFHATGQLTEAIARYNDALAVEGDSVLALFNRHLAQSESFRFKEAEATLEEARALDAELLDGLLGSTAERRDRQTVVDATLDTASIWASALQGRNAADAPAAVAGLSPAAWLLNPVSLVSIVALLAGMALVFFSDSRKTARRCIRCGRPCCHYCKSGREGREYCSQCLHLFVRGDGLAPETKTKKMYEVERYERRNRRARRLASVLLPGSAHVLRGRSAIGVALLSTWLAAWIAWLPSTLQPIERLSGFDLRFELLVTPGVVPDVYAFNPFGIVAFVGLVVVWFMGNVWSWESR
ncbi:MAG: tetratricopeptide repeat protein [bacterium]|nr:tetratricopeptide repeat protein [bacterium]